VWCSRVLKDQLSGDILSHLILKESCKWSWWWYLIQVSLVYLIVPLSLANSSSFHFYLLHYLRAPLWSSYQRLRDASSGIRALATLLAKHPSLNTFLNTSPKSNQKTTHKLHKTQPEPCLDKTLARLPVLIGTTVPLSFFSNPVQKCGTVCPCPSARPCHPHTLPKHLFSLLKEPTCLQALPYKNSLSNSWT